jgi:hypothetical protein
MVRIALSAVALMLTVAGCTTMPPPGPAQQPVGVCDADPVAWAIGNAASPEVVERAQWESHSRDVRVIEPGQAVTMDFRAERLNLYVNERGAITRVACG